MADEYRVDIGAPSASGNNTTAVGSSHVVQYPKPPIRTDGMWMSIGTVVGSLVGVLYNQDTIDDAHDAEDAWRRLTDTFRDQGNFLMLDHADKLLACSDNLHEKLCALADCGYVADYESIRRLARADAALAAESARRKACREANRYSVGMNAEVNASILRSEIVAATTATTVAVMEERLNALRLNWEILAKATNIIEDDFMNRKQLGADLMAGAGQNYAYLAESLRRTAKEDVGDWAVLGALLGALLPILFNFGCSKESYCGDCG